MRATALGKVFNMFAPLDMDYFPTTVFPLNLSSLHPWAKMLRYLIIWPVHSTLATPLLSIEM